LCPREALGYASDFLDRPADEVRRLDVLFRLLFLAAVMFEVVRENWTGG